VASDNDKEVNMNQGVRLTALYAYGCQAVPPGSRLAREIDRYLKTGKNEHDIELSLRGLEPWRYYWFRQDAQYPKSKNEASVAAVRSYWFGTPVLFSPLSTSCSLIAPLKMNPRMDEKKGFNQWRNAGACIFLHQGVRPYHNFVVLAKTALTGLEIPAVLAMANNCIISSGMVRQVLDDQLVVDWCPLIRINERLRWGKRQRIRVKRGYVGGVKVGDVVSLHYGEAREVLTPTQIIRLIKYTKLAIDRLNESFAEARKRQKEKRS